MNGGTRLTHSIMGLSQIQYKSMFVTKTDLKFDFHKMTEATKAVLDDSQYLHFSNQICLTGRTHDDSPHYGAGSLVYEYREGQQILRQPQISENEFKVFLKEFEDSYFFEIYKTVSKRWQIGRMRVMTLLPKTIYGFHKDFNKRLHLSVFGEPENCGFICKDRVHRIAQDGFCYLLDTRQEHTAFNSSHFRNRTHIVFDILGEE
jgi:hypothetical protein